jgi:hypothetical protein
VSTILVGGAFPSSIGCIACDGAGRFMGFEFQFGVSVGFNSTTRSWALPVPDGTLTNLKVTLTSPSGTLNSYQVQAVPTSGLPIGLAISCTIPPGGTSCTAAGPAAVGGPGLGLIIGVGNPGIPTGVFDVPSFSVEFTPA